MIRKFGDWQKATAMLTSLSGGYGMAVRRAILQEAEYLRGAIVQGIRKQAPAGQPFKPLSPWTLAARKMAKFGGTKALIRKGDLIGAIRTHEVGDVIFVGVLRTARNSRGGSLVNIGAVHEYGSRPILIRITPKMRRYLGVLAKYLPPGTAGGGGKGEVAGTGILVLRIPARPFLRPVWDQIGQAAGMRKRVVARLDTLLALWRPSR